MGPNIGADDYVTKPFSVREVVARVKGMLRRSRAGARESATGSARRVIQAGDLELDLDGHSATLQGSPLSLKPREFDLLAMLASNRGRALTRDQMLEQVWGHDYYGDTRTVDVHIRWLREKIQHYPQAPQRIITIRGVGYRFEA